LLDFSRISAVILKVSRDLTGFSSLVVHLANPDCQPKNLSAIWKSIKKIRPRGLFRPFFEYRKSDSSLLADSTILGSHTSSISISFRRTKTRPACWWNANVRAAPLKITRFWRGGRHVVQTVVSAILPRVHLFS